VTLEPKQKRVSSVSSSMTKHDSTVISHHALSSINDHYQDLALVS